MQTLLWHDYETFGSCPRRDRPAQFAALRTDYELCPVEPPVGWSCQPGDDYLPQPGACVVAELDPAELQREGLPEPAFAARIAEQMRRPGTCSVGFNSIRFDSVVTRFLLYRNFHDPYEHEWRDGNSRWDLIDVARLQYALRPKGIHWPTREDGAPSFRLEDLAAANAINHQAHDALADVKATLELAQKLRAAQPRLFDFAFANRGKRAVQAQLALDQEPKPLLHVSQRYAAERGCIALVLPLGTDPARRECVYVLDLSEDPAFLLDTPVDELRDALFTPRADLPEHVIRPPLKKLVTKHCPVLAPAGVLEKADCTRIGLDRDRATRHAAFAIEHRAALHEIAVAIHDQGDWDEEPLAEHALYAGHFSEGDRALLRRLREGSPQELAALAVEAADWRLRDLVFVYRARHFPDTLDLAEQDTFAERVRKQLTDPHGHGNYEQFLDALAAERQSKKGDAVTLALLDRVERWGAGVANRWLAEPVTAR